MAQKKNQIAVRTMPTPIRPKNAKNTLLLIELTGVTPEEGSTDVERGTSSCTRAARRTDLGDEGAGAERESRDERYVERGAIVEMVS